MPTNNARSRPLRDNRKQHCSEGSQSTEMDDGVSARRLETSRSSGHLI